MAFGSSMKDKAIVAVIGMSIMYVIGGFLWFSALTDKASSWNRSQRAYRDSVKKYNEERALIARKAYWNDEYEAERSKMPMFPEGETVGTHWLGRMDTLAAENHISISSRQSGKEEEVGDVFQLPVDVKGWEAALEPLVEFLFALEHAEEAMFDVKSIDMRPSSHKGYLKGQFTLNCAYMRGDVEESSEEEEDASKEKGDDDSTGNETSGDEEGTSGKETEKAEKENMQ